MNSSLITTERKQSCRDGPKLETCSFIPIVLSLEEIETDISSSSIVPSFVSVSARTAERATEGRREAFSGMPRAVAQR